jgi:D-alanine-D-alanine ligase
MPTAFPRSVAIVFDERALVDPGGGDVGSAERAAVEAVGAVIDDVESIARARGARVERIALSADGATFLRQVAALGVDVVVNFAETWGGRADLEAAVGWALQARGIAYTGAPPRALTLCLDKPTTRAVLAAAGVGVADGVVLAGPDDAWPARVPTAGPWIVKPAAQDASHGIDADSVVVDADGARARARVLFERGLGPVLVERFIDGRELNVSMVELKDAPPRILPVAEIVYGEMPAGSPRILTFASKWDPDSADYHASVSVEARDLSPELRGEIERTALAAWRALGLRGYGRVDLRVDDAGRPYVIDVNPNPDLSRDAGLALAASRAGIDYAELVEGILLGALHAHQR